MRPLNVSRSTLQFKAALLAVFAVTTILPAASAQRKLPGEWKWVDKNIAKGCEHATLYSKSMQREIGYSIYLPPSY